jgi:hypothetical protein
MKRVAIMQPTYLPWIGYFGLMHTVDTFILLDSVQFAKRSWQQRNQIKTANGPKWLSVPIMVKGLQDQRICDAKIVTGDSFAEKHIRALEYNYSKAQYFSHYGQALRDIYKKSHTQLVDLNCDLIDFFKNALSINTEILKASELINIGSKADLLMHLCQQVNATDYISPPGSREYLDASAAFEDAGINVTYFEFNHPSYPQMYGDFAPFMSCADLLLNCGPDSLSIIESGMETQS